MENHASESISRSWSFLSKNLNFKCFSWCNTIQNPLKFHEQWVSVYWILSVLIIFFSEINHDVVLEKYNFEGIALPIRFIWFKLKWPPQVHISFNYEIEYLPNFLLDFLHQMCFHPAADVAPFESSKQLANHIQQKNQHIVIIWPFQSEERTNWSFP